MMALLTQEDQTPTCTECGAVIGRWEQRLSTGEWIPIEHDGSLHVCQDEEDDDAVRDH